MKRRIIKQYEHVKLADGREGCVIEVFGDQELFMIDIKTDDGGWDTIDVRREEITE